MENINSALNYENIKLRKNCEVAQADKICNANSLEENGLIIKELRAYCENLEETLTKIAENLKSETYFNSLGLDLITKGRNEFYENKEIKRLKNELKDRDDEIIGLRSDEKILDEKLANYLRSFENMDKEYVICNEELIKMRQEKNEAFAEVSKIKAEKIRINTEAIYLQNNIMIKDK